MLAASTPSCDLLADPCCRGSPKTKSVDSAGADAIKYPSGKGLECLDGLYNSSRRR